MKKALITGITGQDGSYLAEFLLEKGYEVHGIVRRASSSNTERIDHLMDQILLHDGDLTDSSSLLHAISLVQPDEIYNLAAQSHVQVSFDGPEYSGDVDALGVLRILEACRTLGLTRKTRIYQASTSELYGKVEEVPQRETTPFHPYSPYAVAKQYGFWIVKEYREAYGMFAVNGITLRWEGSGVDEKGYDAKTGKMLVCVNPKWFRSTDVDNLWGDPTKAKTVLGWNPQKTSYTKLVELMAKHDRLLAKKEKALKEMEASA